jgi:hypothetical protein
VTPFRPAAEIRLAAKQTMIQPGRISPARTAASPGPDITVI